MNEREEAGGIERAGRAGAVRKGSTVFRSGAVRGGREVRAYEAACARLGLAPAANLLVPVRRNRELVFRATGRAADALAAMYGLDREVRDGPRVLVAPNARPLACAVCRATRPDGESATATATAPLDAEGNALMACETRARRLATLRVLGLEALAGGTREGVPAGYVPGVVRVVSDTRGAGVRGAKGDAMREERMGDEPMRVEKMGVLRMETVGEGFERARGVVALKSAETLWDPRAANDNAVTAVASMSGAGARAPALEGFLAACGALAGREGAAALWVARRGGIAGLSAEERAAAWGALVARVRAYSGGATSAAAAAEWLKRAVREEESRVARAAG